MAAIIQSIINGLVCSDLYEYVLNAMHCKSHCGECYCSCDTDAIPLEEEDEISIINRDMNLNTCYNVSVDE